MRFLEWLERNLEQKLATLSSLSSFIPFNRALQEPVTRPWTCKLTDLYILSKPFPAAGYRDNECMFRALSCKKQADIFSHKLK